jgi:hypothetical protein
MKTEKMTVSVRLEIDKEVHRKVKLIQAQMLLNGKEIGIPNLCADLLAKGVNNKVEELQIEVK